MDDEFAIENIESFQRAFSLFDSDGSNSIPISELGTVMRALGQNPTQDEIENIIREKDQFNTGKIHFDTFRALMIERLTRDNKEQDLMEAFQAFDRGKTGTIKCEDLRESFIAFNKDLTEEQVEEMIKDFDIAGLGDITYKDIVKNIIASQKAPAKGSGKKKGKGKKKK